MKKGWIKILTLAAGVTLSFSLLAACGEPKEQTAYESGVVRAFHAVTPAGDLVSQTAAIDGAGYRVTVVTSGSVAEYSVNAEFQVESTNQVVGKVAALALETAADAPSDLERAFGQALLLSGIDKAQIEGFDFDRDTYMGRSVYKVEIEDAVAEYSYTFDASDLKVLASKTELKIASQPVEGSSYIGEARAKEIALGAAEADESAAEGFTLKSVLEDGRRLYKAAFDYNGFRYAVDVDAVKGEIVKFSKTVLGGATLPEIPSILSKEEVKAIALAFVFPDGAEGKNVTFRKVQLDYERGSFLYEVEFVAEGCEYELEISASDGAILDAEIDADRRVDVPQGGTYLTREEAIAKVLEQAGADAFVLEADIEKEFVNGEFRYFYEIEIKVNGREAEYYVDAITGEVTLIKEYTSGPVDPSDPVDPDPALTEAQALKIALDEFNLTENLLTARRIRLEREDGRLCYEIKLFVGKTEYQMTVDAQTGMILEQEIDREHEQEIPQLPESKYLTQEQAGTAVQDYFAEKGQTARIKEIDWEDEGSGANKRYFYEVEAIVNGREYECYVDAITGEVSVKGELVQSGKNPGQSGQDLIGEEKALEIALDRYSLTKAEAREIEVKLERDDGILIYEVEFKVKDLEYSFEIDAQTGDILDIDVSFD